MNESILREIAIIIIESAKLGRTIQYNQISSRLGGYPTPEGMSEPLGIISSRCIENNCPPLSAIVVRKDIPFPGNGFFTWVADEMGYPQLPMSEWEDFFHIQSKRVFDYKEWDELLLKSFAVQDIKNEKKENVKQYRKPTRNKNSYDPIIIFEDGEELDECKTIKEAKNRLLPIIEENGSRIFLAILAGITVDFIWNIAGKSFQFTTDDKVKEEKLKNKRIMEQVSKFIKNESASSRKNISSNLSFVETNNFHLSEKIMRMPEIRILPMNKSFEFDGMSHEDVQETFFLSGLETNNRGSYAYRNSGMVCPTGTLVLFQFDNALIASAKLLSVERYEALQEDVYSGEYIFDVNTIEVFRPIFKKDLKRIIPEFIGFNQVKQRIDLKYLNELQNLIKDHKTSYLPSKVSKNRQDEVKQHNKIKPTGYWTFFCNPQKWKIDEFLSTGIVNDEYRVTDWQKNWFNPGQLGIVRVGYDKRTKNELNGKKKLESGIYALVQVLSVAEFKKNDNSFWADNEESNKIKLRVKIKYLKNLLLNPIILKDLSLKGNLNDKYLIDGFQASSMPLNRETFKYIVNLSGGIDPESIDIGNIGINPIEKILEVNQSAVPIVKERISRFIERGKIAQDFKAITGYKCQVCEAIGLSPYAFKKKNDEYFVETHHVIPVSENGSLSVDNLMTVCPNHHRQIHHGNVELLDLNNQQFEYRFENNIVKIPRFSIKNEQ